MQCIKFIGIDLAKSIFQVALADKHYRVVQSKRLSRSQFQQFFINLPPAHIIMETCGSTHYWARDFIKQGHQVSLLLAQYVKAYVRRNKTDHHDAVALVEAIRHGELHAVPVKSEHHKACIDCGASTCAHAMRELTVCAASCVSLVSSCRWGRGPPSAIPSTRWNIYMR